LSSLNGTASVGRLAVPLDEYFILGLFHYFTCRISSQRHKNHWSYLTVREKPGKIFCVAWKVCCYVIAVRNYMRADCVQVKQRQRFNRRVITSTGDTGKPQVW